MHNPVTNNSRITINTAGVYLLTTSFLINYTGTLTNAYPFFYKNGTTTIAKMERGGFNSTGNFRFTYTAIEKFSVADYVEVKIDIGGATSPFESFSDFDSFFAASWLGNT